VLALGTRIEARVKFLKHIHRESLKGVPLHLIADNYAATNIRRRISGRPKRVLC